MTEEEPLSEQPVPPAPTPPATWSLRQSIWKLWIRAAYLIAAGLTISGIILRLTIRDTVPGLSMLYYITPPAMLAAGAGFCLLLELEARHRRRARCWGTTFVLLAGFWLWHDWRFSFFAAPAQAPQSQRLKLLFWNLCKRDDLTDVAEYIRRSDADLAGFVEVRGDDEQRRQLWRELLPEYEFSLLGAGMQLLSRGPAGKAARFHIGKDSNARQIRVMIRGQEYECFIVDVTGQPYGFRRESLERVAELAQPKFGRPTIIMGDFNTPPDSPHFNRLRQKCQLLFEVCGHGYAPTWPIPIPVLELDQIWTDKTLKPVSCWHGWTWLSDHRPVHAVVELAQ